MCLLSICIPTYNRCSYLKKTLESIVSQKIFETTDLVEIVISDNCSSDGTADVCKIFAERYPHKINYIRQVENIGGDENFIVVLKNAKGKFAKLNNDTCVFLDNSLSNILKDVQYADSQGALACFFTNANCQKSTIAKDFNEFLENVSFFETWIGGHCYRKSFFESLDNPNRFSKMNFAQVDIIGRIFEQEGKIFVSNNLYFDSIPIKNKSGYNVAKAFGYNYFYILDIYRKKGLISDKVFKKEKKLTLNHHIIRYYFDFTKEHSFNKSGYLKYMKYFWWEPFFWFSYIRVLKFWVSRNILHRGNK